MIDLDLFHRYLKGRCHFVQKWGKVAYPLHLSLCRFETVWDNALHVQD